MAKPSASSNFDPSAFDADEHAADTPRAAQPEARPWVVPPEERLRRLRWITSLTNGR